MRGGVWWAHGVGACFPSYDFNILSSDFIFYTAEWETIVP